MSIVLDVPVGELPVRDLVAQGYTTLTLWYASSPDGVYANAGATVSPATLAAAITAESYTFEFTYGSGNSAMWYKVVPYNGASYAPISDSQPFHGGGGTTLAVLKTKLGKMLGDYREGTTTASGSTTTFKCNSVEIAREPDGMYEGWTFVNADNNEWSPVSAWTRSTFTGTLEFTLTSVASSTSFQLFKRWNPTEYKDAINAAIAECYPILNQKIDYRGLLTADDIYEFTIPGNIREVSSVMIESSNNSTSTVEATRGHPWRKIPFQVVGDGLLQRLEFKTEPFDESADTARRIRILGEGQISQLNADTDYLELVEPQTNLVLYLAASQLFQNLISNAASSDIDRYDTLSKWWLGKFQAYRDQFASGRLPGNIFSDQVMWRTPHSMPSRGNTHP